MASDLVLAGARVVLDDRVVDGAVVIRDGRIAAVDEGPARTGDDLDGDYLLPGLVELHTDHLESHYRPRPGVHWNPIAALQAHDAQVIGAGIVTVFDALRAGDADGRPIGRDSLELADAIATARAEDRLKADHFIHVRCEISSELLMSDAEPLFATGTVRLASLMDHTPGQRQFARMEAYHRFYPETARLAPDALEAYVAERLAEGTRVANANRPAIVAMARQGGAILASHDDATPAHVAEAAADGVAIAEFPTTVEAATASREAGMKVLMGAPNVVRGGSHSGNAAATDLAARGLLDILSSDYVPFSLLQAAFILPERVQSMDLPAAVRLVSRVPAETVGLTDRGAIAVGRRADLVRVRHRPGSVPVVRSVWREGVRVA
jgi:alpha-D-ribose 1-methylphosphonate 5-triphosphate diphosphatase